MYTSTRHFSSFDILQLLQFYVNYFNFAPIEDTYSLQSLMGYISSNQYLSIVPVYLYR